MTITSTICRVSFVGTNSQSVYPFNFLVFQAADLVVQTQATTTSSPITLVLNVDYTVAGLNNSSGGTITLTAGNLPTGVYLSIFRNPAQVQDTQLNEQQQYNPLTVMASLDDLTMMVLALQDQVTRCIQIDPLDTTTPTSGVPGPPYPSCILPPMALGLGQNILRDAGTGVFLYGAATGGGSGPYFILTLGTLQTVTGPVSFGGATQVVTQAPGNNTALAANTAFVTAAGNAILTTVASAYLTITNAASTYLSQSAAAATYQTVSNAWRTFTTYQATANFTVPAGVTEIEIEMWGGGCAPAGGVNTNGGGAGAYIKALLAVTPGQVLNLTIGAGGVATAGAANNGGNTTIGVNGGGAVLTAGGGTGPNGGTASGSVSFQGISGQQGSTGVGAGAVSGFVVAGNGGGSPRGGGGGPGGFAGAQAGIAGQTPGGGGSSPFPGAGQLSGAGAAGQIWLRF